MELSDDKYFCCRHCKCMTCLHYSNNDCKRRTCNTCMGTPNFYCTDYIIGTTNTDIKRKLKFI